MKRTCPLCGEKITAYSIESNNELESDRRGHVTGVIQGCPTMRATCASGCGIVIAASQPTCGEKEFRDSIGGFR